MVFWEYLEILGMFEFMFYLLKDVVESDHDGLFWFELNSGLLLMQFISSYS